jgi:hypothetical protein
MIEMMRFIGTAPSLAAPHRSQIVILWRRAAASPESIFQRLVFIVSGLATFSRAPE